MDVMDQVVSFFVDHGYTIEITLAVTLFSLFFKKRRHCVLRFVAAYVILLAFSVFWQRLSLPQGILEQVVKYLTMQVICIVGVLLCNKVNLFSTLFVGVCGVAVQHGVFILYTVILSLSGNTYDSLFSVFLNPVLIGVCYTLIFYPFYRKFKNVAPEKFESKSNITLGVVVMLMTIVIYTAVECFQVRQTRSDLYILYALYDLICSGLALVLQYSIVVSRKLTDDNEILEYLVYRQEEQYNKLKNNMELVNIKCHDMKQQISLFESRMDAGALEEIKGIINVFEVSYKTGNKVLDAFFAEKSLLLKERDIELDCIVDGACISFLPPSEIYTLFGNAFDNAMEALSKLSGRSKLFTVSVREKLNMVIIHFENACEEEGLTFENGLPVTTKDNTDYHGYGMRSMQLIAEKYQGTLSVEVKDGVFNLNILIPAPTK